MPKSEQDIPVTPDNNEDAAWQLFFQHSPISTQAFSPDGQTIRFNKAWSFLFGYSDEEAYAFNVLTDPSLAAGGIATLIRRAFQGEVVTVPPVPFPVKGAKIPIRWIGGTLYPVHHPDGTLREVTVVHHDVTELKAAEDLLRVILAQREEADLLAARTQSAASQALQILDHYQPVRRRPDFSDPRTLQSLGLTPKEAEVLLWVAQGKSNAETGIILHVGEATIKKHLEHIFEKLGVEKRGAASLLAIEALTI